MYIYGVCPENYFEKRNIRKFEIKASHMIQ